MARPIHSLLQTSDWLVQKYEVEQMSLTEIASELGISQGAVSMAMQRLGIPTRSPLQTRILRGNTDRETQFPMLRDREWLEMQYTQYGLSTDEIASHIGCTGKLVLRALTRLDIPRRTPGKIREGVTRNDRNEQLYSEEWLTDQYINLGRSPTDIALEVGCSESTLSGALARYKIHRKSPRPKTNAESLVDVRRTKKNTSSTGKIYIRMWMPEHPNAVGGYVLEHRLVCEKELGRYLTKKEVVHHLNDNSEDNRPENLMVFPDNGSHVWFEHHPPTWMPTCECCGHALPEKLLKRPDNVPMEWKPE